MKGVIMENFLTMAFSFLPPSKILHNVSYRYKLLLYIVRCFLYSLIFCLRILLSRFPFILLNQRPPPDKGVAVVVSREADSAIARALSQMLSIMHEIPVSSRKYEALRDLAEKLMDENAMEESVQVNRTVLNGAFGRAMVQLEGLMWWRANWSRDALGLGNWCKWVVGKIRVVGIGSDGVGFGSGSPEKLAAELLWMARKMVECGSGKEAVWIWGSASSLAWMALGAKPSMQDPLVKVSAFLFKQANEVEAADGMEQGVKLKMLMSWLPLLCQASNGTDSPVLSRGERAEVEIVLEDMIEKLSNCEQEKVLALWLYHFTSCPNSDWPNLQACYARWYATSRKLFLLNLK